MKNNEFRAFLNLMMCSDPWPTSSPDDHESLLEIANQLSIERGFIDWIDAYHRFLQDDYPAQPFTKEYTLDQSTFVSAATFDIGSGEIIVQYRSTREYKYYGIPPSIMVEAAKAENIGLFISENIKGKYRYFATGY